MSDIFHFDPPMNQSQAYGYIIPEKDGVIELTIEAGHEGNNHDTPWASVDIIVNKDIPEDEVRILHRRTAWQNGAFLFKASEPMNVRGGRVYKIYGFSENQNARSTSIKLSAKRLA